MRLLKKSLLLCFFSINVITLAADTVVHSDVKKRAEGVAKSNDAKLPLNCEGDVNQTLRNTHPLAYVKDETKQVPEMNYDGFLGQGGQAVEYRDGKYQLKYIEIKQKNPYFTDNFDAHSSIWLAHALGCKSFKAEDLIKYLDDEVPRVLEKSQSNTVYHKEMITSTTPADFDNTEKFLKPKELATLYKFVFDKFSVDPEIAKALSEQLLEFAKARLAGKNPNGTEALKKLLLEIGKKFKSGNLNEISKAESDLFEMFMKGSPSYSEKLFGSHLTSIYRALFLSGEPKVASQGSGAYSTDYNSPKFLLAGKGVLPQSVQNALNAISDSNWSGYHTVRNDPEDKRLFWKDPKNPVLIELQAMKEPERSSIRKWARERIFAVEEGKVEGGDALAQEALVQILAALEGTYDNERRRVDKADYATLHTTISSQREKIANHPDSWNLNAHADIFADRLKKTHGIELTEEARKNFLSLGSTERRVLLELSEKTGDPHKTTLQNILRDLGTAQVIDLVHSNPDARKSYYDQLEKDLDLSGDIKSKVSNLIKDLNTADANQNEATIKKAREIRPELIQKMKEAVAQGKKGQAEAEALSRLLNISDEVGLSQEQRQPLDATRNANGQSHYAVPITLAKLEAEEKALEVVREELKRTGRALEGAQAEKSKNPELDKIIEEFYPKSMNVPSHTRALLAQLLLPEHDAHLEMLRRLKSTAAVRDGLLTQAQFRKVGETFRSLLLTPTPKMIEAMMKQFNPKAYDLIVQTQGDKHRQILLKKIMLDPEGFGTILRRMNSGKELDKTVGSQADIVQSLVTLGTLDLLRQNGMVEGIVGMETIESLPSNLALAARLTDPEELEQVLKQKDGKEQVAALMNDALNRSMGNILSNLIHEGAPAVLRGEGVPETAKMSVEKRGALAAAIRKMAGDLAEGVTTEDIIASLKDFNDTGLKVRSELNQLVGKTSPTPPLDLSIADSLNGLIDRQLRRLNIEFNQKNKEYEGAFNRYETFRTEHRLVGKTEWDKRVQKELNTHYKKGDVEAERKRKRYTLEGFREQLDGYKSVLNIAEKDALEAKDLKDLMAGKRELRDGEVAPYTDLNQMRGRLDLMRKAYLAEMQAHAKVFKGDALNEREQKLRHDVIEDYVASIQLPENVTEADRNEIRKTANAYLSSHWAELTHVMTEQGKRDERINAFVEKNYGAEIEKIEGEGPEQTLLLRQAAKKSYANMVRHMVNDAQNAKAKIKIYADAAQEKFDSISPALIGKDQKNQDDFKALAESITPEDGNSTKKLEAKAAEFVDTHLKTDLDKVQDPNARAQQRDFLISQLASRLENQYTTGSTARLPDWGKNWKSRYNQSLLNQLAQDAFGGHSIAYRPTAEEFNNDIVAAHNNAIAETKKSDRETLDSLYKLEALGVTFNGSTVTLNGKSRINRAHLPDSLVLSKEKEFMEKNNWQMCDKFDVGGDAEMRQMCKADKKFPDIYSRDGQGGHDQLLRALETVNQSGIPLTIDHPQYKVTSLDGKGTMEDFMVTMFNQVNQGHNKYTLPLGENDAVILTVDPNSGQMTYELRNNKALSATLRKCMEEVAKRRDIHQLATEKYGEFSTAFTMVVTGNDQRSKNKNIAWNNYVRAVNACSGYGAIDNGSGVTGQEFEEDERESKMNHQLALDKLSNQKFEGNVNVIEDVAIQTAIFVGTMGLSSAVQGIAASSRIALAANSMSKLSYGQKLLYLAAQSERARKLMVAGLPYLEKTGEAMMAASKAYRHKYVEGAKWAAYPLPFVYGIENYNQYKAWGKAERLYREGKFKAPENKDFKTEEEYKVAKKEWDELQERTDRNFNNIPDSLDGMGKKWITPDIAETHASLAGGGEFFGGMSAVHTLFPKLPGISYFSVFGGGLHSNMRDVYHGKKTFGQATLDSAASTLGMTPGLVFMNNAQFLHKLPGMSTKIGLGMYGPTLGQSATAAGIHYLNKMGHHAGEWVGISDPTPPPTPWSEMSVGEKAAWAVNEAIGWKFAFDMAGVSQMRNIARELGKAPKSSSSTDVAVRTAPTPGTREATASNPATYESLKSTYGPEKVNAAITMMTPEELLNTPDTQLFKDAAAMVGKSPKQFREILELEHHGSQASFMKEFGIKEVPKVEKSEWKATSYLRGAMARVKQTGSLAALVLDGQQGWTHDYVAMDKKYSDTVVASYKAASDPAVQKKLANFIVERPSLIAQMEARDLKFNETSAKTDAYMLESLANLVVEQRPETPFSQVPNALNSGIIIDGKFHNAYGAGFAFYVRNRVQNGTAKERSVAILLEDYHKAWESGEFTDVFKQMSRQMNRGRSGASQPGTSLIPVGN